MELLGGGSPQLLGLLLGGVNQLLGELLDPIIRGVTLLLMELLGGPPHY